MAESIGHLFLTTKTGPGQLHRHQQANDSTCDRNALRRRSWFLLTFWQLSKSKASVGTRPDGLVPGSRFQVPGCRCWLTGFCFVDRKLYCDPSPFNGGEIGVKSSFLWHKGVCYKPLLADIQFRKTKFNFVLNEAQKVFSFRHKIIPTLSFPYLNLKNPHFYNFYNLKSDFLWKNIGGWESGRRTERITEFSLCKITF